MMRFELMTSSLPRKRSTPELHRQLIILSGRRDSNSRPLAWKANALSTELLPQFRRLEFRILNVRIIPKFKILPFQYSFCGESRIRTYEDVRQLSYSQPQLATLVSPQYL